MVQFYLSNIIFIFLVTPKAAGSHVSCNLFEYAEVQLSVINDIHFNPLPTQSYRMATEYQ